MKRFVLAVLAAPFLSGCMSDKQWADTRLMHQAYMQQQRTFESFDAEGTNMTFSISGATRIRMSAPLNPLTTIPQAPDVLKDVISGATTIAAHGALGYVGSKAVSGLSQPSVVQAPAAAPAATTP